MLNTSVEILKVKSSFVRISEKEILKFISMNQISSFLPSLRIFQLFGIYPFSIDCKFQTKKRIKAYSILLIGLSTLAIAKTLCNKDFYLKGANIGNTVDYFQLVGMKVAQLVIILESLYHNKALKRYFELLIEVDGTMRKLEFKIEESKKKHVILLLSMIIFYAGAQLIVVSINTFRQKDRMVSYWFDYQLAYFISCLRYFQIFNCVWLIRKRLEILSQSISTIDFEISKVSRFHRSYKLSKPINSFEEVILHREVYHKLFIMSTMVNTFFGLSTLINIANDFVSLTLNSYFVFLSLRCSSISIDVILSVVQSFFWSLPHFANILLITIVCQLTIETVSFILKLCY